MKKWLKRCQDLQGRHRVVPRMWVSGHQRHLQGLDHRTTSHVHLPKSFEEQVPPVARASQGHQHKLEPREPRLLAPPNALQTERVGARMVKRRLTGKQTANQYQPAAGRALDKSFSEGMLKGVETCWQVLLGKQHISPPEAGLGVKCANLQPAWFSLLLF